MVEIPALGMVDYLVTISESGFKSTRMNAVKKITTLTRKKFALHIGNEREDFETGGMKWQDTLDSLMELSNVDSEKYLAQILSSDGTNTKNIQKIKNKGIGIQNKIIQMLDHMPAGIWYDMKHYPIPNNDLLSFNSCNIT